MKSILILFFLLISNFSGAQYAQTVRPSTIAEIFSLAEYNFKMSLSNLYKKSLSNVMVSEQAINIQAKLLCADKATQQTQLQLQIFRTALERGPHGFQITERVLLNVCNKQVELVSIERQGPDLTPTPNADLMRGGLPPFNKATTYRLSFMDKKLIFELMKKENRESLNIEINFTEGLQPGSFIVQMIEEKKGPVLQNQYLRSIYSQGGTPIEDQDAQFVWNEDKNNVPRQYLYILKQEVTPDQYLEFTNEVYNQNLLPLISLFLNLNVNQF